MRSVSLCLLVAGCVACSSPGPPPTDSRVPRSSASASLDTGSSAAGHESPTTADILPTAAPDSFGWLDVLGVEGPPRIVPVSWQDVEVGPVGFAVPPGWQVPNGFTCLDRGTPGYVLVADIVPSASTCATPNVACPVDACADTNARVVIATAAGDAPVSPPDARVGSFDAWRIGDAPIETYRLTNGVEVGVVGPDAAPILATFTDSNPRRALQTGPLADTSTWKTVSFAGVSVLVPPRWELLDLAHQDIPHGFFPDPGTCQEPWFWPGYPRALVDVSDPHIGVSCIVVVELPVRPEEGLWIRDVPAGESLRPMAAEGVVDGMDVGVLDRPLPSDAATANPLVDLIVHDGTRTLRISIGVGLDPTIARTILRSIHRS